MMKPEFVINRLLDYPIAGAYVQHNLAQLNRPLTEKERERRREGKGGGPDKRIYLEALMTTMKGAHAEAIGERPGLRHRFVCNHSCCQYRGFEDLAARRRQHFLCTRDAEVTELRNRPTPGQRVDHVRERLRDAQETARVVRRALMTLGAAAPSFDHLDRWISLLAQEQVAQGIAQ